jgi:small-conductance mechanosensitive channel
MTIPRRCVICRLVIAVLVLLTPTLSTSTFAQDTVQATSAVGAPVTYRGDTLFTLYGTIGPFTAAERAVALERRIAIVAEDPELHSEQVAVVDTTGAVDITIDTLVVMTVTERDAVAAGVSRAALAEQYATEIRRVVEEGERPASLRSLLIGGLLTLAATVGLVIALVLISRFFPVLYRWIGLASGTWIRPLRIQRLELLSAAQATEIVLFAARVMRVAVIVLLIYIFLPSVLSFFPWTRGLANTLFGWTLGPLGSAWNAFVGYLPNMFTIAVLVVVFYYILKFIHLLFTGLRRGTLSLPGFYRDWAMPTYKIVRFLVIVFAAIVIFPYLPGSQTPAFRGISIFLGVLISFGSSSAIANVVAGVVMTYMHPFQIGDRVKIADTVGDVVEKTLLITRIRTVKNVDTTVPNAMVLSSHIINYSSTVKQGGVILHTGVTIGYDVPWRHVHELLQAAAAETADVLTDPKPFVLQTSLDDFYVSYELNACTDKPNVMARIYSELHQNIQDKFREAGVEIMSPHYRAERDGSARTIPTAYRPAEGTAAAE